MGAKYLPTVKDQKANQRFLQKQAAEARLKKLPGVLAVKKSGKK